MQCHRMARFVLGRNSATTRHSFAEPLILKQGAILMLGGLFCSCAVTTIGVAPASAKVSSQLATKCQQMALQAHPADLPDKPAASGLRRSYYRLCIQRRGNMDPELRNP
jgi:hypothetical protein